MDQEDQEDQVDQVDQVDQEDQVDQRWTQVDQVDQVEKNLNPRLRQEQILLLTGNLLEELKLQRMAFLSFLIQHKLKIRALVWGEYQAGVRDAYPISFTGGDIVINASVTDGSSIDMYFKFAQTSDSSSRNDYITEPITISGSTSTYVIDIPSQGINIFDTLTMHITTNNTENGNGKSISGGLLVNSVSVTDDEYSGNVIIDDIPAPQDNNQELLHLMMTPIFYLWNPYNVEIVMDSHPRNEGSYEYFYGPPDIEGTFDGDNWIDLRSFGSFQFGNGEELMAIWSSNNRFNRATDGQAIEIPAGEFKFNRVIPTMMGEWRNYPKMQFFDINRFPYGTLFSYPHSLDIVGKPTDMDDVVANWVQTTDQDTGYADDAFTGLFTPLINPDGEGKDNTKNRLKKLVTNFVPGSEIDSPRLIIYDGYKFNLRLKTNFSLVASRLVVVGTLFTPDYNVNRAGSYLFPKRMIGALNIDDRPAQLDPKDYLSTTLKEPLDVSWSQLDKIVLDNGRWGDIRYSPKISLNVDIRGFSEKLLQGSTLFP